MPKVFTSATQKTGEIGESVAVKFLMKQGFTIIERNYTKKWGEIDIVAEEKGRLHFIEVKSVSRENLKGISRKDLDQYRPEDNMHPWKLKRLGRTIQTYLLVKKVSDETGWQFDFIAVFLDLKDKIARVKVIKDIVL